MKELVNELIDLRCQMERVSGLMAVAPPFLCQVHAEELLGSAEKVGEWIEGLGEGGVE